MSGKARRLLDELAPPLVSSWWTVVAGVCVGLSAGMVASGYLPTSYRATLTVRARDGAGAGKLRADVVRPEVLARLAERAAGSLVDPGSGPSGPAAVEKQFSVSATSAQVFELTVQDEDPGAAVKLAERIGEFVTAPGRPFELTGRPISVEGPAAPQPLKVRLLGVAIGLIVFVGPPLVRTAVNPFICSERAIRDITEVPLLGTIPRIDTPDTAGESRRRITVNVGLAVLSAGALAIVAMLTMA